VGVPAPSPVTVRSAVSVALWPRPGVAGAEESETLVAARVTS